MVVDEEIYHRLPALLIATIQGICANLSTVGDQQRRQPMVESLHHDHSLAGLRRAIGGR